MEGKRKNSNIFNMVVCALFASVMCVLSPITIPIGPVPISLGILGVMFTAVVLGPIRGIVSVVVFLLIGVCGVPIFSGGNSGIATLLGPTGGYVWSYLLVVIVVGFLCNLKIFQNKTFNILQIIISCFIGVLVCYTGGTIQFMLLMKTDIAYSISVCVAPFVVFDIIKCIIAGVVGYAVRYTLLKAGYLNGK
ncbi:MAG: biotin transporter BioY [Acutalibacteraceae bacterium]